MPSASIEATSELCWGVYIVYTVISLSFLSCVRHVWCGAVRQGESPDSKCGEFIFLIACLIPQIETKQIEQLSDFLASETILNLNLILGHILNPQIESSVVRKSWNNSNKRIITQL